MAGHRVPEIMSFRNITKSTATLSLEVSNYLQLKSMGVGQFVSSPVFKVGGYNWEIKFYPNGYNKNCDGYASCYLCYLNKADDVSTQFMLSMIEKKSQEQVVRAGENLWKRVFSSVNVNYNHGQWGHNKFVNKAKLESLSQHRDSCFTILCVLAVSHESPPLELPSHLEGMLKDERGMDVTFNVDGQEYRAHRFVLAARSPVFRALLFGPMEEKDMQCLDVVDMEPFIFKMMLHYIYTDSRPECEDKGAYSAAVMQHLLVAADRYGLERLKLICEEELCEKVDAKTITTTLKLADQHECKRLKDACLKFVSNGRRRLRPRA